MNLKKINGIYQWHDTINGQRYRLSTGTGDKAEAVAWVASTTRKILLGEYGSERRDAPISGHMTITQACRKAELGEWRSKGLAKKTISSYVAQLAYIAELKGDLRLCDIDEDIIEEIRDLLCGCDRDLDNPTVNRYLMALSSLLSVAKSKWRVLKRKPELCLFPENAGRIFLFEKDDVDRIIQTTKDQDFADFILFLYETGCRMSEGLRATPKDIDLQLGVVRLWETKNKTPRGIPISAKLRPVLERRAGVAWDYTPDQVRSRWDTVRKALGKMDDPGWIMYTLRHTRATLLLEAGVPITSVQAWLGHKRIETTQRYAKITRSQLEDAAKLMDSFATTNARKLELAFAKSVCQN